MDFICLLFIFLALFPLAAALLSLAQSSRKFWLRIRELDPAIWEELGRPNGLKFGSVKMTLARSKRKKFSREQKYKQYKDPTLERIVGDSRQTAYRLLLWTAVILILALVQTQLP